MITPSTTAATGRATYTTDTTGSADHPSDLFDVVALLKATSALVCALEDSEQLDPDASLEVTRLLEMASRTVERVAASLMDQDFMAAAATDQRAGGAS